MQTHDSLHATPPSTSCHPAITSCHPAIYFMPSCDLLQAINFMPPCHLLHATLRSTSCHHGIYFMPPRHLLLATPPSTSGHHVTRSHSTSQPARPPVCCVTPRHRLPVTKQHLTMHSHVPPAAGPCHGWLLVVCPRVQPVQPVRPPLRLLWAPRPAWHATASRERRNHRKDSSPITVKTFLYFSWIRHVHQAVL